MQLYLQYGHGMMAHTRQLLTDWGGGGVILSPRDLNEEQLRRMASQVLATGSEPLLDPQCFARDADHHRLLSHAYWDIIRSRATGAFLGGAGTASLLAALAALGNSLGVRRHILPGILANPVNEDWFAMQEAVIAEAPAHYGDSPLIATVAMSSDAMNDEAQIEAVIERAKTWNVQGFYVVAETPTPYLVDAPIWLADLMLLTSGLKLLDRDVIVGYANHQLLCLAAAGVDTIASGTWLNVRAFPPEKFYAVDEDQISRRAIWYYCPHALSEYKLQFLDIAQRAGTLGAMAPHASHGSLYAAPLFAGPQPSTVNWGEQNAFRHYLTCLRAQVRDSRAVTFDATLDAHRQLLSTAETALVNFRANGVFGQDREFSNYVDVNRSALTLFERARGARMRRSWR